ncbi:AraC family transcriptional regulator [Arthrobacter pigmenti]
MFKENPPLSQFRVVQTSDLEEAQEAVAGIYLPHDLRFEDQRTPNMSLNAVEGNRFTLGYLSYGTSARLIMPATHDSYHANLTIAGNTFGNRQDGDRAITESGQSGLILSPEQTNTVRWTPEAEQLILKIPSARLQSHLSDLIGNKVDTVIDFDFSLDLSTPAGASFLASVKFMAQELERPNGLSSMPLAIDQLESFIMSQLLTASRHPYMDELLKPAEHVRSGRLKPVLDYIEMNIDEPLTPDELARAGGMSIRTLHSAFQRTFEISPMAYVRRMRLDRVRTDLIADNNNAEARVTDVAMKWGFFHLSRFAQQYKQRFGESPSETVRRHSS